MLQLDVHKAYDMVEWGPLEQIMHEFCFPKIFTEWVMTVVENVTYMFNLNRNYTTAMEAKRGLRHGDHISPLLFVLIMEYLTRYLQTLEKLLILISIQNMKG